MSKARLCSVFASDFTDRCDKCLRLCDIGHDVQRGSVYRPFDLWVRHITDVDAVALPQQIIERFRFKAAHHKGHHPHRQVVLIADKNLHPIQLA